MDTMDTRDKETCCICGGELGEGSVVLFTDEEGNKSRIDKTCREAIDTLKSSEDAEQISAAIAYMESVRANAQPQVQRRVRSYIRRGEERLNPDAAPRSAPAPKSASSGGAKDFAKKALGALARAAVCVNYAVVALCALIIHFFAQDTQKVKLGKFSIGVRAISAFAALVLILLLIIIIPGGSGCSSNKLVGKWQAHSVDFFGEWLSMDAFGLSSSMPVFEFKSNGKCVVSMDGEKETGKWSTKGDVLTITTDGETIDMEYEIVGKDLIMEIDSQRMKFRRK